MEIFRNALLLFVIISALFGVYKLLTDLLHQIKKAKEVKKWLKVKGKVVSNEQVEVFDGDSIIIVQKLIYVYEVSGLMFENLIEFDFNNIMGANRHFAKFKSGDKITILYNPSDFQESYPASYNFEIAFSSVPGIALIVLILLIGAAIYISNL